MSRIRTPLVDLYCCCCLRHVMLTPASQGTRCGTRCPGRFSGDEHAHRHGAQSAAENRRAPKMRRRPDRSARANRGADPVTPAPPDYPPNDPMSADVDTSPPITNGATPAGTNAENQPDRGTVSVDRRMRKHPTAPRTNLTSPGGSQ